MFSTPQTREMAQRVLDYIHEHPEKHDQYQLVSGVPYWEPVEEDNFCGSTMCVCGTAVFLTALDNWQSINEALDVDSHGYKAWYGTGGPMLGLETEAEQSWLFDDMDNEGAVQKLKTLVVGEIPTAFVDNSSRYV